MTSELTQERIIYNGKRSVILRRLKRVDLKCCMESLEKYSSFAKNLFKTQVSCITIVDSSIVWVLAASGTSQKPMFLLDRKNTYCDKLMNPDDVNCLIIPDKRNNSMGIPSRDQTSSEFTFYAGVALEVQGTRVGTLYVEDTKPRPDFEMEYLTFFKELAVCISDVLQSQMHLSDQLILGWTSLMVGVTHNLRTPLSIVTLSVSEAMTQITKLQNKYSDNIETIDLVQSLDNCRDAEIAAQQLQLVIDANSNLGNLILSYESKISPRSMMTILSRLAVHSMISRIRQRLLIMEDNHSIQWFINELNLADKTHRTFSDAIEQSITSAIAQFMVQHAEISVYINFKSESILSTNQTFNRDMTLPQLNEGYIVVEVTFQVETYNELQSDSKISKINGYDNRVNKDHTGVTTTTLREFDTFSQRFELQLIERLLKVIGGRISKLSTTDGRSGRLVMQFPCEVLLDDPTSLPNEGNKFGESKNDVIESSSFLPILKLKPISMEESVISDIAIVNTINNQGENVLDRVVHQATDRVITKSPELLLSQSDNTFRVTPIMNPSVAFETSASALTAAAVAVTAVSTASATATSSSELKIKALIIEDGIPVQKILSSWLKRKGCEVQTAINGKLGLEKLKSDQFQIVFCDFLMPVQDGVTTMRLYQQYLTDLATSMASESDSVTTVSATSGLIDSLIKRPLIVGISATANKEDLEEAFSYGMNYFCQKPLSADVLDFVVLSYQSFHDNIPLFDNAMEEKCNELVALGKPMAVVTTKSLLTVSS